MIKKQNLKTKLFIFILGIIYFLFNFSCTLPQNSGNKKSIKKSDKRDFTTLEGLEAAFEDDDYINNTLSRTAAATGTSSVFMYGDVNADGFSDMIDSFLISRYYVGGYDDEDFIIFDAADVNDDGLIDTVDSLLIAQRYVNLIDSFDAELNLISNPHFHAGFKDWWYYPTESEDCTADIVDGGLRITINNGGDNLWDVGIGQSGIPLESGKSYQFKFKARTASSTVMQIGTIFQLKDDPWDAYHRYVIFEIDQEMKEYSFCFTMETTDLDTGFNFHVGGENSGEIYIDDIYLHEIELEYPLPYTDVRGDDLSGNNIGYDTIKTYWFNTDTIFSSQDQIYADEILEKGKSPGLGVKNLHLQGIDGTGINVAIIDQNLVEVEEYAHSEYLGKVEDYKDFGCEQNKGSMHGPAVLSLLVGETLGTAPGARVYYAAAPSWYVDAAYYADALYWIIEQNNNLLEEEKIRVVSVSADPTPWSNSVLWQEAVAEANLNNILVLDCGDNLITRMGFYDLDDPDNFDLFICGTPESPISTYYETEIFTPACNRTQAEQYYSDENKYQFTGIGGYSWTCPYTAGVLAMGWQVNPDLSIDQILTYLFDSAYINPDGNKIINPGAFIQMIQDNM